MRLSSVDCQPMLRELMDFDRSVGPDTIRRIDSIFHDGYRLAESDGDVVFVFGSRKAYRYDKALDLWLRGCARHVLLTGGVTAGDERSEAEVGRAYLVERGVPSDCILLETASRDTMENMRYALPVLRDAFGDRPLRIVLVSISYHMRRCMLIAQQYAPEEYSFVAVPAYDTNTRPDTWFRARAGRERMARELRSLLAHIENGWCADFDVSR